MINSLFYMNSSNVSSTKIPLRYINYEIKFVFEQIFTHENNNKKLEIPN